MAEKRTRRSFTREFKAQAVKRLLDGGKGLSEVATELGIGCARRSWRGPAGASPAQVRGSARL
jgi:transposase